MLHRAGQGVVSICRAGDFFGEVALFSNIRRTSTVNARTICELMVLSRQDLHSVQEIFPELARLIDEVSARYAAQSNIQSLREAMSSASFVSRDLLRSTDSESA